MAQTPQQMFYACQRWRRLANRVLLDDPWCTCGQPATLVHHVRPIDWRAVPQDVVDRAPQGRKAARVIEHLERTQPHALDERNLQGLCRDCHEAVHGRSRGGLEHPDRAAIRALGR